MGKNQCFFAKNPRKIIKIKCNNMLSKYEIDFAKPVFFSTLNYLAIGIVLELRLIFQRNFRRKTIIIHSIRQMLPEFFVLFSNLTFVATIECNNK